MGKNTLYQRTFQLGIKAVERAANQIALHRNARTLQLVGIGDGFITQNIHLLRLHIRLRQIVAVVFHRNNVLYAVNALVEIQLPHGRICFAAPHCIGVFVDGRILFGIAVTDRVDQHLPAQRVMTVVAVPNRRTGRQSTARTVTVKHDALGIYLQFRCVFKHILQHITAVCHDFAAGNIGRIAVIRQKHLCATFSGKDFAVLHHGFLHRKHEPAPVIVDDGRVARLLFLGCERIIGSCLPIAQRVGADLLLCTFGAESIGLEFQNLGRHPHFAAQCQLAHIVVGADGICFQFVTVRILCSHSDRPRFLFLFFRRWAE